MLTQAEGGLSKEVNDLAKPNYQYEKRQKDIAKKAKQEEKRLRKQNKGATDGEPASAPAGDTTESVDTAADEAPAA